MGIGKKIVMGIVYSILFILNGSALFVGDFGTLVTWATLTFTLGMLIADTFTREEYGDQPKTQQQAIYPSPVEQPPPAPPPQPVVFKCKHCGKEFKDENKLRRHIGMSHFDLIET